MRVNRWVFLFVVVTIFLLVPTPVWSQSDDLTPHVIQPGDTWSALSWQYGLEPAVLKQMHGHMNRMRQPTIGTTIMIPVANPPRYGIMSRPFQGGLLQLSAKQRKFPWVLAKQNGLPHPYYPPLLGPIVVPGGDRPPQDLPPRFTSLEVAQLVSHPGEAIAFRAESSHAAATSASLGSLSFEIASNGNHLIGFTGTGAFYPPEEPELTIQVAGDPLWSQPWRFEDKSWSFQQITLTGSAAEIDQDSIARERERLFQIWSQVGPRPLWSRPFTAPIDSFLEVSSAYGARRSYNGGPYRTYHEGVDFSAYGGTDVYAPAAGIVVLAEMLYVRGGAVIIDHGLGIFTGTYHLSLVNVSPGDIVEQGQLIGAVGTTGLSTGNHLHWDLLVTGTWIDGAAWLEQDMGCWLLNGLGESCEEDS